MASKKHAEVIRAWLDGAQVQIFRSEHWYDDSDPSFHQARSYRIRPQRIYPLTTMTDSELFGANANAHQGDIAYRKVANEAIKRAIDSGQVLDSTAFSELAFKREVLVAHEAARAMYNDIYTKGHRPYCDIALDYKEIIARVK